MGEAKRRADARYEAKPYRPPRRCPRCKSTRIEHKRLMGTSHVETDYDMCLNCATCWEAYPENWCEDVVGAEPCDNCAFRPGSPEQADPEEWKKLVALLKAGREFRCHKGSPILGLAPGSDSKVEFDADWVQKHGRTCAGFMRMVWSMRDKGEDWFSRHMEFCGAPGYDMPIE
jgi:hypothetical protein